MILLTITNQELSSIVVTRSHLNSLVYNYHVDNMLKLTHYKNVKITWKWKVQWILQGQIAKSGWQILSFYVYFFFKLGKMLISFFNQASFNLKRCICILEKPSQQNIYMFVKNKVTRSRENIKGDNKKSLVKKFPSIFH